MVNYQNDQLSGVFSALADPTRRAILARLALGDSSVGELAEPFEMSLPAVSKHLKVLETAGLVQREKQGRIHRCQLNGAAMRQAADWIDHYRRFWEGQFESLARYLNETGASKRPSKKEKGDKTSGKRKL